MTTFWCADAQLPDKIAHGVRIQVADGRIESVTHRRGPDPADVRLDGLVLPGMANGHSHIFHRALRGRTHGGGGNFWSWRDEMYAVAARLTPETYRLLARAVLLEMLTAGWTAVGEFHYLHHGPGGQPYADPNAMGQAVIDAADEVGIRLTLLDTCYLHGGLTPQGHIPLDDVQQRFADADVSAWATRVAKLSDGPLTRIGAAAHSVRALTRSELDEFASATVGRHVHAHVSEQPAENAACVAFHGLTPTELLADLGLLDERFTAVHATHLSDRDIDLYGRSGASVCACPTTERDLADGIGPFRRLADAGVPLTVGSDQSVLVDPFVELRGVEMHERLHSGERGRFSPRELLAVGGAHGYASLGWGGGGQIAAGALADFIAVNPSSRRTAGASLGQIVYAAGAGDVTDVVVGGTHVVRRGEHRLGSVDDLLVQAMAQARGVRG
ncbi:MAG: formimidoylglutamate deiminase [Phycicoccus sp.]|nr:formimidoylglutamate deiminase [Phycicoccus sp.]